MYQPTKEIIMKATIIFASAFRATNTEVENAHNSIIASQKLGALVNAPVQTCVGSWKEEGEEKASTELTFVAPVALKNIQSVADLFIKEYNQDAVLAVNPVDMSAHLINSDGSIVEIGTFQTISEEEAKASECYTYWQGKYWLAK
ncbi:SAM-dependent methyltransferase [Vibrio phage phi-A318]|uniref:Uncharacterized protein n=2 Tax=Kaohsiungvirus TaxID=2731674 RepID=A0A067YI86_9CAUD|nr:SAM-dependent methyltransferase [Vibrio phage phi-A318]YP_009783870.1 SAM-dependent methyltransferase [Vibrio phage AS51]AGZ17775.1 hypothetical protein [Vibrio phage phi-A318]AHC94046.1 hypothetical protein [Vibrio phage AS51]